MNILCNCYPSKRFTELNCKHCKKEPSFTCYHCNKPIGIKRNHCQYSYFKEIGSNAYPHISYTEEQLVAIEGEAARINYQI